jgi:hypothetical protein
MLMLGTPDESQFSSTEIQLAKTTYDGLHRKFGYSEKSAKECIRFLMANRPTDEER